MTQNKKTLAMKYGVHVRTFCKMIRPIKEKLGPVMGRQFSPRQVKMIYDHLGEPGE